MKVIFIFLFLIIMIVFFKGMHRALVISQISVKIIKKYEQDKNNPRLIDEIFEVISDDFWLNRILTRNHATKADIKFLHSKLMIWGDFRKYNRYIPINSFFNVSTLDYLLKHKSENAQSLTKKMMEFFHF